MARIREIKLRMKAVSTIQRITKTMQMIATAKFTNSLQRAHATRPYSEKVSQLVAEVVSGAGDVEHPLINGPTERAGRELILVIASDRGLCGAFNANVLRTALRHLRDLGGAADLEISGKKAVGFFKFQKIPVRRRHTIGDRPDYRQVEQLAAQFIEQFKEGKYDAVRVVSMRFISPSRQTPQITQLLPLKPPVKVDQEHAGPKANYEFSPSTEALLDELLPLSVKTTLFQAFNDAVVSEQIMRMVAMKAATENAAGLGKDLRRRFNRARQTQITTELMEVISGAAALE